MKHHDLDPISLIFGLFFAGVAFFFLLADVDVTTFDQPWVLALPVLFVGLIVASIGFRNVTAYRNAPERDDETSDSSL